MTENLSESDSIRANRIRNVLIALVALALGVTLFLGVKTESGSISLEAQAKQSTPLEIALNNGKPSLIEFYADWCTSCQAMAADLAAVKKDYADSVNFVMLNVDNTKWLPEVLRYRVDGIPHFIFVNAQGEAIAQSIGEQPRSILKANIDGMIAGLPLPYITSSGQVSNFNAPFAPTKADSVEPRTHSSQLKS